MVELREYYFVMLSITNIPVRQPATKTKEEIQPRNKNHTRLFTYCDDQIFVANLAGIL